MVEKLISLDNISLPDFFGVENKNIEELKVKFPKCTIISRGEEIKLKGATRDLIKLSEVIDNLILHYRKHGQVDLENVKAYLAEEESHHLSDSAINPLVFGTNGNAIRPKTVNQKKLVDLVYGNDLVFALGPAGTGKTYISVALAIRALKNKEVKKIVITRPAVEAGESLGFLPGDLKDKVDPYLRPIYDALDDMVPKEKLKYYMEHGVIEIAPLAYMRGRTLHKAFILLDEAQNTTPMQIKMFLTRMGPESKVVITGDTSQIDLPKHQNSGLVESIGILKGVKGIGVIHLEGKDVVRHKLVKDIIRAYEKNA